MMKQNKTKWLVGIIVAVVAMSTAYEYGRSKKEAPAVVATESEKAPDTELGGVFYHEEKDEITGELKRVTCLDSDLAQEGGRGPGRVCFRYQDGEYAVYIDLHGESPWIDYQYGVGQIQVRAELPSGEVKVREYSIVGAKSGGKAFLVNPNQRDNFAELFASLAAIKVRVTFVDGSQFVFPYSKYAAQLAPAKINNHKKKAP